MLGLQGERNCRSGGMQNGYGENKEQRIQVVVSNLLPFEAEMFRRAGGVLQASQPDYIT